MLIQMTSTKLPVELVFIQLIFNICTSTPKHKRLWCVKLAMFNFKNTLESCKIHERWKESTKIQKPDTLKSLQDEQSLSWSVPPLYPKDFIEQFSESCYYITSLSTAYLSAGLNAVLLQGQHMKRGLFTVVTPGVQWEMDWFLYSFYSALYWRIHQLIQALLYSLYGFSFMYF